MYSGCMEVIVVYFENVSDKFVDVEVSSQYHINKFVRNNLETCATEEKLNIFYVKKILW